MKTTKVALALAGSQQSDSSIATKTYPAPSSTDGYVYESYDDEALGVETVSYPNGGKSKRVTLSDGRVAICRRIKTKEMIEAQKVADGNVEHAVPAVIACSTKLDDQVIVKEDVLALWGNDYNTLKYVTERLNF